MANIISTVSDNFQYLPALLKYLTICPLLLCSTFIFTSLRLKLYSLIGHRKGTAPLTLPYWIPFIGNSIHLSRDAHAFYVSAQKASPDGIMGVRIGPMYCYFISSPRDVQAVFRASKAQTMDPLFLRVFRKIFALPAIDARILKQDTSGHHSVPFPGSNVPAEKRIWKAVYEGLTSGLQGAEQLGIISSIFLQQFLASTSSLAGEVEDQEEGKEVLLFQELRDRMSIASSHTLIRTTLFDSAEITSDFWHAHSSFLSFFVGFPRFLIPKAWDARERVTRACTEHLRRLEAKYDAIQQQDPDWGPDLGSRGNRLRDKADRDMGMSIEGRGSMILGFMTGINGNSVPVAGWLLLELAQNPTLMSSIRVELQTCILRGNNKDIFDIDIPRLTSLLLLTSIYTETLRLRMSTTSIRLLRTDLHINSYHLRAGNWVMLASHLAQLDSSVWATDPLHPPDQFWAERFLEKENVARTKTGSYFPFGGGSTVCPGRFFAKQEILIAVAVVVMRFEIEVLGVVERDGTGRRVRGGGLGYERGGAGACGLFPDGDLRCWVNRRV